MAGFMFKLETADRHAGRAAVAQQRRSELGSGEAIHLGHRTLRVIAVRDEDGDQPCPVLVVEDVAE